MPQMTFDELDDERWSTVSNNPWYYATVTNSATDRAVFKIMVKEKEGPAINEAMAHIERYFAKGGCKNAKEIENAMKSLGYDCKVKDISNEVFLGNIFVR